MLNEGITIQEIGDYYGVSKQRIYQVMTKMGLSTNIRKRHNFLRDKGPEYYWLNKMLCAKKLSHEDRISLLGSMSLPKKCPMLGITLNYEGNGLRGFRENSPSIDQIRAGLGYVPWNMQIISWRANRIKNDSTPEELQKIATYMINLTKTL